MISDVEKLRAFYRSLWDTHQVIAHENFNLVRAGGKPTVEQLIDQRRAAEAVACARDALLAAMRQEQHRRAASAPAEIGSNAKTA